MRATSPEPKAFLQHLADKLPHIGMRKVKSVLALFIAFWFWQFIRLFLPGLEVHPIFMYLYSVIEIRDSSEKTVNFGKRRIKATFTALCVGLPSLTLLLYLKSLTSQPWVHTAMELSLLLLGVLLTISIAEVAGCKNFCGLAGVIFIVLVISHGDDMPYIYAIMRAVQTIAGVFVAWLVNVKWLPYPGNQPPPPAAEEPPAPPAP